MKNCLVCAGFKSVFVRAYIRMRLGRLEKVTQHCRSTRGQNGF